MEDGERKYLKHFHSAVFSCFNSLLYAYFCLLFLLLLFVKTAGLFTCLPRFIKDDQNPLALNVSLCRKAIYPEPLSRGRKRQEKQTYNTNRNWRSRQLWLSGKWKTPCQQRSELMNLLFHPWNVTTIDITLEIIYCEFNMCLADNEYLNTDSKPSHVISPLWIVFRSTPY